jgi:cytochrome b561
MSLAFGNSARRWGLLSQLFHWTVVVLIIVQFVLANIADDLPLGMKKLAVLANHKSFGITILALAILRLLWRRASPGPGLPEGMSRLERIAAQASHHVLYLLLFLTPLTGWAMSSAKNYSVSWFNLVPLPNLVSPNDAVFRTMHEAHELLATAIAVVAGVHALAALRHHFMLKDDVLKRILPFGRVSALVLAVLAMLPTPRAEAANWSADPARSTLGFSFKQAGAVNTGRFARFTVAAAAPGTTLAGGTLTVTIETGSLDTKDKDRDATLKGADLFDVAKHPTATFAATRVAETAPGQWEATGTLSIRGVAKPVRLSMTVRAASEGGQSVVYLAGKTTIRRLEFGVGQGDWKSTEWVADEVGVEWSIRLVETPAAARRP